jgi:hypothetical protein
MHACSPVTCIFHPTQITHWAELQKNQIIEFKKRKKERRKDIPHHTGAKTLGTPTHERQTSSVVVWFSVSKSHPFEKNINT